MNRQTKQGRLDRASAFSWLRRRYFGRHAVLSIVYTGLLLMATSTVVNSRIAQAMLGAGVMTTAAGAAYPIVRKLQDCFRTGVKDDGEYGGLLALCLIVVFAGSLPILDSVTLHVDEDESGIVFSLDENGEVVASSVRFLPSGFHLKAPWLEEGSVDVGSLSRPLYLRHYSKMNENDSIVWTMKVSASVTKERIPSLIKRFGNDITASQYTIDFRSLDKRVELLSGALGDSKNQLTYEKRKAFNSAFERMIPSLEPSACELATTEFSTMGFVVNECRLSSLELSYGGGS
jgi:hypothetical protein